MCPGTGRRLKGDGYCVPKTGGVEAGAWTEAEWLYICCFGRVQRLKGLEKVKNDIVGPKSSSYSKGG